jgi:chromosome partitioning protein
MIATNLAGYYAAHDRRTVLIDHDPQEASMQWLKVRPREHPPVHGIAASQTRSQVTRTFQMRIPAGTERIIIDTAAGVRGHELTDLVREADLIIIPVLPSHTDIHAVSRFIAELLLEARVRSTRARLGLVANRVRHNTRILDALKRFLARLQLPVVTELRDSQNYIHAFGNGISIHEVRPPSRVAKDVAQWTALIDWLETSEHEMEQVPAASERPEDNPASSQSSLP